MGHALNASPAHLLHSLHLLGNHAQGVALSGSRLKIPCTIVMPEGTPSIKVRNASRLGAKVVLHGVDFDEARRIYMQDRFSKNGIAPDGRPRDPKFVSFS